MQTEKRYLGYQKVHKEMSILITIPCLMTGGIEIQTLNLVRALVGGGHEVVTACYFEHTDYMVEQYEKAGNKVVMFSQEGKRVGGLARNSVLGKASLADETYL